MCSSYRFNYIYKILIQTFDTKGVTSLLYQKESRNPDELGFFETVSEGERDGGLPRGAIQSASRRPWP